MIIVIIIVIPNCNDNYLLKLPLKELLITALFKQANEQQHKNEERQDSKIIEKWFWNCTLWWKISEVFFRKNSNLV